MSKAHGQIALLVGRILIGSMFLAAGIQKVTGGISPLAATIDTVTGLPMSSVLAVIVIVIEIVGGLALIVGYHTRKAAVSLALFTLVASLYFHRDFADQIQMLFFTKNMAIIGGLLAYLGVGAGSLSLDTKLRGAGEAHNLPESASAQ